MIKGGYNLSTRKIFPCRENFRRLKVNLYSFSFLFSSSPNSIRQIFRGKRTLIIKTPLKEVRKDG
jgi:hypothetical protein